MCIFDYIIWGRLELYKNVIVDKTEQITALRLLLITRDKRNDFDTTPCMVIN